MLTTFSQHTNEQELSNEQQAAAKNHYDKVAMSLSQCIDSNSNGLRDECSICLEIPSTKDIAITPCSHVFCRKCLLDSIESQNKRGKRDEDCANCPFCMIPIKVSKVKYTKSIPMITEETKVKQPIIPKEEEYDARATLETALRGKHSSKISAVMNELDLVWGVDHGSKVIIFSQYLGMLNLIGKALSEEGITHYKLDGKMSLKERRATLKQFNSHVAESESIERKWNKHRGSVLLASMKACGVGLNLVAASTVFIVDPW